MNSSKIRSKCCWFSSVAFLFCLLLNPYAFEKSYAKTAKVENTAPIQAQLDKKYKNKKPKMRKKEEKKMEKAKNEKNAKNTKNEKNAKPEKKDGLFKKLFGKNSESKSESKSKSNDYKSAKYTYRGCCHGKGGLVKATGTSVTCGNGASITCGQLR